MPAPIELALSTLLPTIGFLPPELIALATSLVAQSRSKAASLKPEEEIARTYACAHIACDRLANKLNLDVGKAVPPVKPRVYVKLKGYLDGVLEVGKSRPAEERGSPMTGVEYMEMRLAAKYSTRTTPTSETKRPRPDEDDNTTPTASLPTAPTPSASQEEVPDFVMPLIRSICKANALPSLAPHISVGASYAVREIASRSAARRADAESVGAKRRRRTPQSGRSARVESPALVPTEPSVQLLEAAVPPEKWPALCLALFLFTAAKMEGLDVQASRMKGMREKGMHAVKAFCEDKRRVLPEELTGGRLEGVLESSVTFYMLEAEDCGWLEMEWFGNVPVREEGLDPEGEVGGEIDEDDEGEEMGPVTPRKRPAPTPLRRKEKRGGKRADDGWEDEVGAAGLLPGLGTMFQPAIDWLSDERRAEYAQWKKGIMREIAVIEQKV